MIALCSDHGGFELKEAMKKHLDGRGLAYKDFGTDSTASCDYPVMAERAAAAVVSGECDRAVMFCGTGAGICIAANKINGIRAVCCSDTFTARHAKMHNDANVITMGGRVVGPGLAADILDAWLDAAYEGGRHQRRVDMLADLEKKQR